MKKKTKIIATLGPATESLEKIIALGKAGADIFRLNTKHSDASWHKERIGLIKKAEKNCEKTLGVLVDLQGPEIRINTRNSLTLTLQAGQEVILSSSFKKDVDAVVPEIVISSLAKGDLFLVDDGFNEFTVVKRIDDKVVIRATSDATIGHRKGINIPSKRIPLPSLTEEDKNVLIELKNSTIDYIALSFSRTKKDIYELRKFLETIEIEAKILAKIESQEALDNIDTLIDVTDGIMIARGDLGVEIPFEQIAYWQNEIIKKCRHAAKPVIVATQMLDSMVVNSRPTRAEVTDVANAVFGGADVVMLSAETATCKYPIKTVDAMTKIITFNENKTNGFVPVISKQSETELIVHASIDIVKRDHGPEIDRIVVFTESGLTARLLSRYRPHIPIYAITNSKSVARELTITYGVEAYVIAFPNGIFRISDSLLKRLKNAKIFVPGEKILVIHGQHWREPGQSNAVLILNV